MKLGQFRAYIEECFGQQLIEFKENEEYGYCNFSSISYRKIGYATNITPEVVLQAVEYEVDLILTHHDAWDFVYGMKEKCVELLKAHNIAHFYVHLPLDYAEFGTCNSLLKLLGVSTIIQQSRHVNGNSIIGIGELAAPLSFNHLVEAMHELLGEKVYFHRCNDKPISRIGMITGAGNGTDQLKEAMTNNCDVYITGEKTLYTVQYAQFIGMNLIVGSHTFTEIFGVRSFAEMLRDKFEHIEIIQLYEEHIEVMP